MTLVPTALGLAYAAGVAVLWGVFLFYLKRYFNDYPPALVIVITNVFSVGWFLTAVGLDPGRTVASELGAMPAHRWLAAAAVVVVFAGGLLLLYHAWPSETSRTSRRSASSRRRLSSPWRWSC